VLIIYLNRKFGTKAIDFQFVSATKNIIEKKRICQSLTCCSVDSWRNMVHDFKGKT